MRAYIILYVLTIGLLAACNEGVSTTSSTGSEANKTNHPSAENPLFRRLSESESGIDFQNNLTETQEYNYFRFQYTYNGAGVAVGDLDNDGLPDLYFVGNQVADRLYRNLGGLKFEDITAKAGIDVQGGFNFGVVMVDINQDGWQDIYVCRSGHAGLDKERANLLFINNKDLTFTESAEAYGLADRGFSVQAAFFDYDKDGDLDMYLTNHPVDYGQNLKERLDKMKAPEYEVRDRLYRNEGNETFKDVSMESGIWNYGHGLGLVIWDINGDGWDDVFVGNDYQSADYVYINNHDGTFTDRLEDFFPHIPYYSMGVDAADINNDGFIDVNIVEMLPDNYHRKVLNLSDLPEKNYYIFQEVGFHHQYTRNCLFMNNGSQSYSDVALMAGVEATDWSWSSLFGDYDNDGLQDLFITNGYLRDMQDKDYIKRSKMFQAAKRKLNKSAFDSIAVSQKLRNYLYMNQGHLSFQNGAAELGLTDALFSCGAAQADLDGDGDIELILNNVNLQLSPDPAIIYENLHNTPSEVIRIRFQGNMGNRDGEGVRVTGRSGNEVFIRELRRTRGFLSGMDKELLIGIGDRGSLKEVKVIWPDGAVESLGEVNGGAEVLCKHSEAKETYSSKVTDTWAKAVTVQGMDFTHKDKVLSEFDQEQQLPFRLTMQGPQLTVGDVDGNGEDDLFICGGQGQQDALYLQVNGAFRKVAGPWVTFAEEEHIVAEFCDVDNDGDLDLYVGSGSTEFGSNDPKLLDKLFINEGKGYRYAESALPRMLECTSVVTFGDLDGDGDLDAFVGSRSVPFNYGEAPHSFLLLNEGGTFSSVASTLAPDILKLGMVSDATWTDLDQDGDDDLIVVGEWSSPSLFMNENGHLKSMEELKDLKGLWRSLEARDLDGDGRPELILGNIGPNVKYDVDTESPLRMYTGDLDGNKTRDLMIAYRQGKHYHPDRTFTYLKEQFPSFSSRFPYYADFTGKSMEQIFGESLAEAQVHEVNELRSVVLWNRPEGFEKMALDERAQISSINAILPVDLDGDGDDDLVLAGNEFYMPIQTGSMDGGIGLVLMNEGNANLTPLDPARNGALLKDWVKDMELIIIGGKRMLVVSVNNGVPIFLELAPSLSTLP